MNPTGSDAAARRMQRLRTRGLTIEAHLDAAADARGTIGWTSAGIAESIERTRHALAHPPREPMLAPWVLAALLVGEFRSAREWLAGSASDDTRALLGAACRAFDNSTTATERDTAPPTPSALMKRVQSAAAAAEAEDEIAVCTFVALAYGLLGPQPDAARDRLTLHAELPAGWHRCTIRNLHMGDAAFDVTLERDDGAIRIEIEQTEGALPATLILEATVRAPVARVEVDGRPADLALRPALDHVVVPVQLVLDAPRLLEIGLGDT